MKKYVLLFSAVVVLGLFFVISSLVRAQGPTDSQPGGSTAQSTPGLSAAGDDSNPVGTPEVIIPAQFQPQAASGPQATPVATIYFTPQDENSSTTIIFLYNTSTVTATVGLTSYYLNGSTTINTSLNVPPAGLVRICADSVSTVSASWANFVLVNFTTFSAYAKMTLPAGVKAEGYIAWDTTGTYDPLTSLQTLPLRFSTDPPTAFLPTLQR